MADLELSGPSWSVLGRDDALVVTELSDVAEVLQDDSTSFEVILKAAGVSRDEVLVALSNQGLNSEVLGRLRVEEVPDVSRMKMEDFDYIMKMGEITFFSKPEGGFHSPNGMDLSVKKSRGKWKLSGVDKPIESVRYKSGLGAHIAGRTARLVQVGLDTREEALNELRSLLIDAGYIVRDE